MDNIVKSEIIQIIDSVSRERGIPKARLISSMEEAIQSAACKKYGIEHDIIAKIDQNTGKISLFRELIVVDAVEDTFKEISLKDALEKKSDSVIGDTILEPLPPIDLGRVAAQAAKQVIVQKVGEIERERQYADYKDRKGDILNGIVNRIEFGNVIVDIGRAEGILYRNQQIHGEIFQVGDRIKSYIQDVRPEAKGFQIFLSRNDDNFLRKLFEMEVPEIYDNAIIIESVARESGSKAKIAVSATDISIDPVGSCVGVRGNRVKGITHELSGEKIDVIRWDKNPAQFIINAMTPAEISKIIFDEQNSRVEAIVAEDQLSMAIGRRGQNVRLASKITGWKIDVMTEDQESQRRTKEFTNCTKLFVEHLEVEKVTAQLLSSAGYTTLEQVACAEDGVLESIEGFDKELVAALKNRAINYTEEQTENVVTELEKLGVEQDLLDLLDLPAEYILKLAEFGIKNVEDLAEITISEFREIVPINVISQENIKNLIVFAKEQETKED